MQLNDKKILVIKPSSLGDVVHTLPLVHSLKRTWPDCQLGWVVQSVYAPLLKADPAIDRIYPIHIPSTSDPQTTQSSYILAFTATMQTIIQLRRQLRPVGYDIVLDLHASFRSGLIGLSCPGGKRYGFHDARELNPLFQHVCIRTPREVVHALEKNLLFCDYFAAPVRDEDFFLHCPPEAAQQVVHFLEDHGLASKPFVYCQPAARWQSKFWGTDRWARLADQLVEQGVAVVFGGSDQDEPLVHDICSHMRQRGVAAAGNLGLTDLVALLKRAAVYVGLDSGPMHMAAMVQTPVVALFGPTQPERVAPYNTRHAIIRANQLDCLGCRRRSCRQHRCMDLISPEKVLEATLRIIRHNAVEGRSRQAILGKRAPLRDVAP